MKTMGLLISHKNGERRRAILPEQVEQLAHPERLYFETGYGESVGRSDAEYEAAGAHVVSRETALCCDIITDVKLGDADYLEKLGDNKIRFGEDKCQHGIWFPDGRLSKLAVNRKSEWVEDNGKGVRFADVVVPSYGAAVELVKRLHKRLAHFKIIGWDIGIDKDGDPVLIEFNTNPGQNQYSCGPTFGDLTDRVLEDVFIKKTLANSNN